MRRCRGGAESDEPIAQELLDRPTLADNVDVHPPAAEDQPWVVARGEREYIRVGKDLGRLLKELDGRSGHQELAERLGEPWTPTVVSEVVGDLHEKGLIEDGSDRRHSGRWVKYVPPLTIQFTLLRPQRLLAAVAPLIRLAAGRTALTLAAIVGIAGIVALLAQGPEIGDALSTPLAPVVYLAVVAGFLLSTILHEMAHGAALVRYGGRPSRIGIMLFYLSPAFFCDVSDAWRLPYGWQRVRIALAGIGMQTFIACLAAIAALAGGFSDDVRHGLLLFAVVAIVASVLNLIPLIKLDGYIALMSWLDVPHLRDRSMTDARRVLGRALFGGRYRRELPDLRWAPLYGLACMLFPVFVVLQALALWVDLFSRMGIVGATLLLCGFGYLAYALGRGVLRVAREALAAQAPRWRVGAVVAALGAIVVVALVAVSVPYRVAGGYVARDGETALVVPREGETDIPVGSDVRLASNGPVLNTPAGSATTTSSEGTEAQAPLAALVPIRLGDDFKTPVMRYPLRVEERPEERTGTASVDLGHRPLGEWLYRTYVAPAIG